MWGNMCKYKEAESGDQLWIFKPKKDWNLVPDCALNRPSSEEDICEKQKEKKKKTVVV